VPDQSAPARSSTTCHWPCELSERRALKEARPFAVGRRGDRLRELEHAERSKEDDVGTFRRIGREVRRAGCRDCENHAESRDQGSRLTDQPGQTTVGKDGVYHQE